MDVVKTVVHAAAQVGAGVLVGSFVDTVFTMEIDSSKPSPARLAGEVILQLAVNALLSAGVNGLAESGNFSDPAKGYAFMFCLAASQPILLEKVQRLAGMAVIRELEAGAYLQQSNTIGKPTAQTVRNATVYA